MKLPLEPPCVGDHRHRPTGSQNGLTLQRSLLLTWLAVLALFVGFGEFELLE